MHRDGGGVGVQMGGRCIRAEDVVNIMSNIKRCNSRQVHTRKTDKITANAAGSQAAPISELLLIWEIN